MKIPYGGWTITEGQEWDPCAGGHPGFSYTDEITGLPLCTRCGRLLDYSPCGCGTSGHEYVGRSYCPLRIRKDQRDLRMNRYHLRRMFGVYQGCT